MTLKVNPVTLTLYSSPKGRYHHPLTPLNLLNPVNPHTEGVSSGVSLQIRLIVAEDGAAVFFGVYGGFDA